MLTQADIDQAILDVDALGVKWVKTTAAYFTDEQLAELDPSDESRARLARSDAAFNEAFHRLVQGVEALSDAGHWFRAHKIFLEAKSQARASRGLVLATFGRSACKEAA